MTDRPSTTVRALQGLRSGVSIAAPIAVGWAMDATGIGLIASLGAFTCRFGAGRPYVNRAIGLATVAFALAAAVALGTWAAQPAWLGVAAISGVGVAAVWLCNALSVGPPGAYVFVVACAAGIGVAGTDLMPWKVGLLVLAGGTFAWSVQMIDVVRGFRAPERAAVIAAGDAVAGYIERANSPEERSARHRAATALHKSWNALVTFQPAITFQPVAEPATSVIHQLRAANHAIHVLFTSAINAASHGNVLGAESAEQARALGRLAAQPEIVGTSDSDRVRLSGPPISHQLMRAIHPGSHVRLVMVRVAIAAPLAGAVALLLGLGHPYWAMAAAVLLLHQGTDRTKTLRRGIELVLGTWLGLALAGAVLMVHPQGLWLAASLAVFQICIAVLAPRNYTFAAVFITATALTIASGTHRVEVGPLVLARGIDVVVGCAIALPVYLIAAHFQESTRITESLARTLHAAAEVIPYLAAGEMSAVQARAARRDLQAAVLSLKESEDAALAGPIRHRTQAEQLWPAIVATERLAYRVIAACWTSEHRSDPVDFGRALLGSESGSPCTTELRTLARAARTGAASSDTGSPSCFIAGEITAIKQSLRVDR